MFCLWSLEVVHTIHYFGGSPGPVRVKLPACALWEQFWLGKILTPESVVVRRFLKKLRKHGKLKVPASELFRRKSCPIWLH